MALEHKEILELVEADWRSDRDNRDDALSDLKFAGGDQWNPSVKAQREAEGRPVLTINRMGQFVRQVSGNLRQSYPAITPVPVDGGSDKNLKDIFAGLIRQIEYLSAAGSAYAWGAECSISCGIGHWRVDTRYSDDDGFDQDICIKRIMDPLSVIWDAGAIEVDRSDAHRCTVTELIPQDEYKRRFPKAEANGSPTDFPTQPQTFSNLYWQSNDKVRIASYWFKVPTKKLLGITQEGKVFDLTKLPREAADYLGVTRTREAEAFKIQHVVMNGADFLTDFEDWAGSYIPVVPCIGNEIAYDGTVVRHGIVRWAKDPQRLYNFWRSYAAELIGMQPKAPWLVTAAMVEGRETEWGQANRANLPYLTFNPDPDAPGLMPKREAPPAPPAAIWQEAEISESEMKATTGVYDAALGNRSNETSGVAIEARQQQTDNGSFVYFDNFNHAIRRTGQILVDLIPKIYDGERTIRILGTDAEENFVPINQTIQTMHGPVMVNDMSAGKFDVRIKTGPSYVNAQQEARDELGRIIQADPQLMQIFGDLYFEAQNFPLAEKLAERMKKAIPPNLTQEGPAQPQGPDPAQMAIMETQLAEAQAKIKKLEAEAADKEQSAIGKQLDNAEKAASLRQFGPEPPQHVQKAVDRAHQQQETRESRFHSASEAERSRQFSRQERLDTQATQPVT